MAGILASNEGRNIDGEQKLWMDDENNPNKHTALPCQLKDNREARNQALRVQTGINIIKRHTRIQDIYSTVRAPLSARICREFAREVEEMLLKCTVDSTDDLAQTI